MEPASRLTVKKTKNLLRKIHQIKSPTSNHYAVVVYLLNADIKDDLENKNINVVAFAVAYVLAVFPTFERAEEFAEKVVRHTGYSGVVVSRLGHPIVLKNRTDPQYTKTVVIADSEEEKKVAQALEKNHEDHLQEQIKEEEEFLEMRQKRFQPGTREHKEYQQYIEKITRLRLEEAKEKVKEYERMLDEITKQNQ